MTRTYINSNRIDHLVRDMSPKDLAILRTLDRLRLASADQIERLHFVGETSRNRRKVLQSLADRRLVVRLDRTIGGARAGSAGYLYALSVAGRRVLRPETFGAPVKRPTIPGHQFIAHTLAVTELGVRLYEAERRGQVEVIAFETEPRCWRRFPGPGGTPVTCKPDAYVRLGSGAFEDSWFIEVDRATEGRQAIDRQLGLYRRYWASGIEQDRRGVFPRVVWLVPDVRRHQTMVDNCARQPAESWQLHLVTLYDNAIPMMAEGSS